MRRQRTLLVLAVGLLVMALATPAPALAHGLAVRADLPIPTWLFGWTAGIVLVVSFVGLAAGWRRSRFEPYGTRPLPTWLATAVTSRAVEILLGAFGVFLLGVTVWSGLVGAPLVLDNFAPSFVYIAFALGLVPISVVFGDVFRAVNPWFAIGRAFSWAMRLTARSELPPPLPYPDRLGHLPAAVGLVAFAWLELIAKGGQLPRTIATATLVYTAVTLVGMAAFGVRPWIDRGEAFSVYFGLFARLSPFERRDRSILLRPPLAGLATLQPIRGTVLLLAVMLGTVTFDGAGEGPVWRWLAPRLEDGFGFLGDEGARLLSGGVGLAACVALLYGFYRFGAAMAGRAGRVDRPATMAGAFVHSLVPIAAAYVLAHYVSFMVLQGQGLAALISDPLGRGWDIFGTASAGIDFTLLDAAQVWYLQVALVVAGHVAGLVSAHDRALVLFGDSRAATRSQLWMLLIMVALTSFALWLLNNANA